MNKAEPWTLGNQLTSVIAGFLRSDVHLVGGLVENVVAENSLFQMIKDKQYSDVSQVPLRVGLNNFLLQASTAA